MTDEQLEQWEALANAATPGPWVEVEEDGGQWLAGPEIESDYICDTAYMDDEDMAFVTAARTAVPLLITEVYRLRNQLALVESYGADQWSRGNRGRDPEEFAEWQRRTHP